MKKRKDGLYSSQVYLGMADEKRKYKTVYGRTQKEVKSKVAELKLKLGKGIDIAAADEPFSVWAERFIKNKEAEGVSHSHLTNLKSFNGHLKPIQKVELTKVTTADIQAVIDSLALYHDGQKPLSKRMLTGIKQFASQVYKMAIGSRAVDFNPAQYVIVPKNAQETHREAITEEQQRWVAQTPHEGQIAAMIMLYAGLRRGELLALTWQDINLNDGTISVSKAVEYIDSKPNLKSTKTSSGIRTVKMPSILTDFLRRQREQSNTIRIISARDGSIPKRTVWSNYWKRYMQHLNLVYGYDGDAGDVPTRELEMKIETFTPHQLRHTYATLLYQAGVDPLTARDQMGHTDIKTTLGIYTHLDKKYKRDSMSRLDEYLCKCDASEDTATSNAITL